MPDNTLKIIISCDQNSANLTKRVITDLTASMEKLVGVTNRLSVTMAGLNGGGSRGLQGANMSATGRSPLGTVGGAAGPLATMRGGSKGLLGNILGGSGTEISQMGTATVNALGSVENRIKTFVSSTVYELNKLQGAVTNATSSLGEMGGGNSDRPGYHRKSGEYWPDKPKGGGGRRVPSEVEAAGEAEEGAAPGPSTGGRRGKKSHKDPITGEEVHPFRMNALSQYGTAGGILSGFFPGVSPIFSAANLGIAGTGLAARYGWGKGEEINQFKSDERMARISRTLDLPFDILERKATMAAPFEQWSRAVMSKNYSQRIGYMTALNSPEIQASLHDKKLHKEAVEIETGEMKASGAIKNILENLRLAADGKGPSKGFWDSMAAFANPINLFSKQGLLSGFGIPTEGTEASGNFPARTMMRQDITAGTDAALAQRVQAAASNNVALQGPVFNKMVDEIYGNALGRTQTQRALGGYQGIKYDENGVPYTNLEAHEAALLRRGYTPGEEAGARQAILGIGKGYGKYFGQSSDIMMGLPQQGLTNIAQLANIGGLLTGSAKGSFDFFNNVVQKSLGEGGLDVAPGREIIESLGNAAIQSGAYGVGGNAAGDMIRNIVGLAAGANGSTFDVAEQKRQAMILQLGLNTFGKYTSGTAAPVYDVMATVAGIQATGGQWSYATDVLKKLPPALLKSIDEGGEIPVQYAGFLTRDMVHSFLQRTRPAILAEVMDKFVPGNLTGKGYDYQGALREVRAAGGDIQGVIKSHMEAFGETLGGVKKKDRGKLYANELVKITQTYGGLYGMAYNKPWAEGEGTVKQMVLSELVNAKGIHGIAPTDAEKAALIDQYNEKMEEAKVGAGAGAAIMSKEGGDATDTLQGNEAAVRGIKDSGAGLPGSFGNFKNALDAVKAAADRLETSLLSAAPRSNPIPHSTTGPSRRASGGKKGNPAAVVPAAAIPAASPSPYTMSGAAGGYPEGY